MNRWLVLILLLVAVGPVSAKIVWETVAYDHNGVPLEGTVVYNRSTENKRPALILYHDWMGPGPRDLERAKRYAGLGYIVFIADMFGRDVRPTTAAEASAATGEFYRDRDFFRKRAQAAHLFFVNEYWMVDKSRVATLGISFGGSAALELARLGTRLSGTVAINASLEPANQRDARAIQGRVLVVHADDDPYVAEDEVHQFIDEMRAGEVDYQLVVLGGAQRGFMNPDAPVNVRGVAYDPHLEVHTWMIVDHFLEGVYELRDE